MEDALRTSQHVPDHSGAEPLHHPGHPDYRSCSHVTSVRPEATRPHDHAGFLRLACHRFELGADPACVSQTESPPPLADPSEELAALEPGPRARAVSGGLERTRMARMVEGNHRAPPWTVGVWLALSSRAIWRRLLPFACSARMWSTSSSGTAVGRPGGAVCALPRAGRRRSFTNRSTRRSCDVGRASERARGFDSNASALESARSCLEGIEDTWDGGSVSRPGSPPKGDVDLEEASCLTEAQQVAPSRPEALVAPCASKPEVHRTLREIPCAGIGVLDDEDQRARRRHRRECSFGLAAVGASVLWESE